MGFGAISAETTNFILEGDDFWPDLSLAEFLNTYRLPAEYAEEMLAEHLKLAKIWAVKELESFKNKNFGNKFEEISLYGIKGAALTLFKRAVFCRAKAILLEQFATIERRESAKNDAKESPEIASSFFAEAHKAIASLQGKNFINVAAI